jgi:hypothetical protein
MEMNVINVLQHPHHSTEILPADTPELLHPTKRATIAPHHAQPDSGEYLMRPWWIRVYASCMCLLFASSFAAAQDYSKVDLFGGYSYLRLDTQGIDSSSLNAYCTAIIGGSCPLTFHVHPGFNGFEASGQFNFNRWLGLKGDFAGHYGNLFSAGITAVPPFPRFNISTPDEHIYDYLLGPVVTHRARRYSVFAHALFGGEHVGYGAFALPPVPLPITLPSGPQPSNWFAAVVGGGLDIPLTRHFSVRAAQFDYHFVNASANGHGHRNDLRISTGIVFGFGGK